jgi:chitodextrinase
VAILAITAAVEIGSLIYQLVSRPPTPKPQLASLQISNAQNGAPIPFGYGTTRHAGQLIWTPGLTYKKFTEGGGSSFGGVTNYTFYASFAIAFGEGPATIDRLWGDSKLIYDSNPLATSQLDAANYPAWDAATEYNPGAAVSYNGLVYECVLLNTGQIPSAVASTYWLQIGDYPNWSSIVQYNGGDVVTRNGQLWVAMNPSLDVDPPSDIWQGPGSNGDWQLMQSYYGAPTFYPGDDVQGPDPLIQSYEGIDVTPGYRGLCYIVFDNFPLANFGDRIPNLRAEVTWLKVKNVL